MAATASTMIDLGTIAPSFSLPEPATGKTVSLSDFNGAQALVVAFICNHCPFVKLIKEALADFGRDYADKGVAMVAISSNDVANYPADGPDQMADDARRFGYSFPYLFDESQEVARAYKAACTPDFFLFDADRRLVYRGQFDGARPGNAQVPTGQDLRTAVEAVLLGQDVSGEQIPSIGCNIKWKAA